MHDCLYRNRETASWVAYGDFDEYLEAVFTPPQTIRGFLRSLQRQGQDEGQDQDGDRNHGQGRAGGAEGQEVGEKAQGLQGAEMQGLRVAESRSTALQERDTEDQPGGAPLQDQTDLPPAWVSHGCFFFLRLCASPLWAPRQQRYAAELLLWRDPLPFCQRRGEAVGVPPESCPGSFGRRKDFVNPRLVRGRGGGERAWHCLLVYMHCK